MNCYFFLIWWVSSANDIWRYHQTENVDPELRERFRKGILYLKNIWDGLGKKLEKRPKNRTFWNVNTDEVDWSREATSQDKTRNKESRKDAFY